MFAIHAAGRRLHVLLLLLALAAGCSDVLRIALDDEPEVPVKNEPGLNALGTQFGQAVQKADFAAAYALCSSQLKARKTEEQFVTDLKNDWQLHSEGVRPQKIEVYAFMVLEDEFKEWEDMPKDIKYAQLAGIVTVTLGLHVEDDEVLASVATDLVVVEEGGQLKIAYVCELITSD